MGVSASASLLFLFLFFVHLHYRRPVKLLHYRRQAKDSPTRAMNRKYVSRTATGVSAHRLLFFRLLTLAPAWAPDDLALPSESVDLSSSSKSSAAESVPGVSWTGSLSESTSTRSRSSAAGFLPSARPTVLLKAQTGRRTTAVSKKVGSLSSVGYHLSLVFFSFFLDFNLEKGGNCEDRG